MTQTPAIANKPHTVYLVLLGLALQLIAGCASNPVTGHQDIVFMSERDEVALGQKTHPQIIRQYGLYNDLELQNYVQYVGNKLAEKSHRSNLNYRFTVLDSKDVNAFALPGGFVYITRGLMAYLNSEAELAAVLAHEIGHITARHAVRQHSASQMASLGAALGAAFIPGLNQAGSQQLVGVVGTALLRGYGREHELQADRLGAEYLARTGYDSGAIIDVIRVLKNQESVELRRARDEGRKPHIYHGIFASHPDSDTRLHEVVDYAKELQTSSNPRVGHEDYLRRIDGMVYGQGNRQGLVKGRDFYHGDLGLAIRFPARWKISNLPDRVFATAPGSEAMLQLTLAAADPRLSAAEYLRQKLDLKQIISEQALKIPGVMAHTAITTVDTSTGESLARVSVLIRRGRVYVLAGLARNPRALGRFDGAFLQSTMSFRGLTPAEQKIAGETRRINVVKSGTATDFAALAQASKLGKYAGQELRLLNGLYPRGKLQPGQWIKTVN